MAATRLPRLDRADVNLLRLFCAVVECGGFTPAQAQLNLGASVISTRMAALETRLGVRLCQRGRVGFRLTEQGARVYEAACRLLDAHQAFASEIGDLRGELGGVLRIGMMDNTITNPDARIHQAIGRFMARGGAVHLVLEVAEPATIERRLLDGSLEVGVAAFYHHVPALSYEPLFAEEQMLCCGALHPLFARAPDQVGMEEILAARYVDRGYIGQHPDLPPVTFNVAATAYDMEAIAHLVLSGYFIGYLPAHYAAAWLARGEMRPLLRDRLRYHSRFEVTTRKGVQRSRALEAFVKDLLAA
jgi:DNA-binding transcriptional LysR family regulator